MQNLTGGSIAVSDLSLQNIGGTGLLMNNVATNATFGNLTASNTGTNGTGSSAVAISGATSSSTYNFTGNTRISSITSPNAAGFSVNNTDAIVNVGNLNVSSSPSSSPAAAVSLANTTGPITFGNLIANTTNATGLSASHVSGLTVNGGVFTTVNAPAINVQSSVFNAKLTSVSVNGGPFGVELVGSTAALPFREGKDLHRAERSRTPPQQVCSSIHSAPPALIRLIS